MKKLLVSLLVIAFATRGNADLRDRLQPILSGDVNIAVDTFIIGTHDRYIAAIVRDIDHEIIRDLSMSMTEMLNNFDRGDLVIIERQVFDKNSKKFSLAERKLVLKSDLQTTIAFEPLINSDLKEAEPGSTEELIWNGVAGPDGWGIKVLSEYPEPVELSHDKTPVGAGYVGIIKRDIGGIFLDRDSIKITDEGCSALTVETFNYDAEVHYGGMVTQYAHQPYVEASYAITASEFSFEKKAYRQLRFTVFGLEDQIIYSVKIANPIWETEDQNPFVPFLLSAIIVNLPEDVSELLSNDIKAFEEHMKEKNK